VHLRTGSEKTDQGANQPELGEAGKPAAANSRAIYVGTHALIEPGFASENLGLVIIDEQHKFGVVQREELLRKGAYPHLLVMTATPIPRTLGLTVYGELDTSIIDQIPPGRGKVQTFVRSADKLPKVWEFIAGQIKAGRQAYVVCPRVEETTGGVKAVTREFEAVKLALAPARVGLLHGRLKPAEKESVMADFRANRGQVLLATSLIEVGLDIPNATVMLIENAEQFGLAQLHQLRGRIGRGAELSYCILVARSRSPDSLERLRLLERTADGFQVAEADLTIRGPGEFLGQEQSGFPDLKFGDLAKDAGLIQLARQAAIRMTGTQALTLDQTPAGGRTNM
jgi:ATP-dependent DNA helicase RecG